jgi:hypothetical protein
MGWFGNKEATDNFRKADAALEANYQKEKKAGIRHDTDEFKQLNEAVHDAKKGANPLVVHRWIK